MEENVESLPRQGHGERFSQSMCCAGDKGQG